MRLVREHINEKFTEDSDPITDMGIGVINQLKEEYLAFYSKYHHYGIPKTKEEITIDHLLNFCFNTNKSIEIIELLLQNGADLNSHFTQAITKGLDFLKLFINRGLIIEKNNSKIAFSVALNNEKLDIADYFINELNLPLQNKNSLILRYSKYNKTESVKWLIKHGADPTIYNYCVLRYALKNKNFELLDIGVKEYIKKRNMK
jgi:hypothetical protein